MVRARKYTKKTYKNKNKNKNKTRKNKTRKNKTRKNKNNRKTRRTLSKHMRKIGGTTPPSKRRALGLGSTPIIQLPPCRYGTECTRKNPQHKREESHPCKYGSQCHNYKDEHRAMFTHEEDEEEEKEEEDEEDEDEIFKETEFQEELEEMYKLFISNAPDIIPEGSKIKRKMYAVLNNSDINETKKSFYYNLLKYIAINRCKLVNKYSKPFFRRLVQGQFEGDAITGLFPIFNNNTLYKPDSLKTEPKLWRAINSSGVGMNGLTGLDIEYSFDNHVEWNKYGLRGKYSKVKPTPKELKTLPRVLSNTGVLAEIEMCPDPM